MIIDVLPKLLVFAASVLAFKKSNSPLVGSFTFAFIVALLEFVLMLHPFSCVFISFCIHFGAAYLYFVLLRKFEDYWIYWAILGLGVVIPFWNIIIFAPNLIEKRTEYEHSFSVVEDNKCFDSEREFKTAISNISKFSFSETIGYYTYSTAAGHLFIVQGKVNNNYNESRTLILIEATILNDRGKKLGMKTVYAGKTLTEGEINEMSRSILNDVLDIRFRMGKEDFNVEPGGTIPFMIVFKSPVDKVNKFIVKPVSSSL